MQLPTPNRGDFGSFIRSRSGIVLLGFLAIGGFFLVTEHTAHFLGVLPWLFLLACPLMHLFMHGGHGGGSDPHAGHDQVGQSNGGIDR